MSSRIEAVRERVRSRRGRATAARGRDGRLRSWLRGVRERLDRGAVGAAVRRAHDRLGRRRVMGVGAGVLALLVVLLVVVLSSGDGAPAPGPEAAEEAEADGAEAEDAQGAVASVLEDMSTAEKVGQLMLVGPNGTDTEGAVFAAIEERGYGGIVIGPTDYESPDQASDLARAAAAAARRGEGVAPWVMAPQPGGQDSALADLPPEKAPARIGPPADAAEAAADSARELLDAGVNGVLAPSLDIAPFAGGEIGDLAYSDDEDEVSKYARATVRAYGKEDLFAAPGRFPGLGGASQTTEEGPVSIGLGLAELRERDLRPFEAAIEAGAPGMVVGPGIYQTGDFVTPASLSPTIATKLLRERLGFKGVAIADDLTAPAVTATVPPADAAVESIKAGVDLVYVSRDAETQEIVHEALMKAVEKGKIEAERLDEAVKRSLAAKRGAGLLDVGGGGGDGSGDGGPSDGGSGGE